MAFKTATCDGCGLKHLDGDIFLDRYLFRLREEGWICSDDGSTTICPTCSNNEKRPPVSIEEAVKRAKGKG
jgi:hypothetical protein